MASLWNWLRSGDGLIVAGVGLLIAGLMGFDASSSWSSQSGYVVDPGPGSSGYSYSLESRVMASVGGMLAVAGLLKRTAGSKV